MSPPPSQIFVEIIISTNNKYTNPSLLWDQVYTFLSLPCVSYAMLVASQQPTTQCVCARARISTFSVIVLHKFHRYLCNLFLSILMNLKLWVYKLLHSVKVWEVQIWQIDPSTSERKDLVSTARVTLLANLSTPDKMKSFEEGLKKFSSKL